MTTLIDHFRAHARVQFRYVGTIYGLEFHSDDGLGFAEMLADIDPQAEMVDHPAYGGGDGFYIQSGDIWHRDEMGSDELVFEAK